MKFLRSFLRPYFDDKPPVASRNVVRFLTVASGIFLNIMLARRIVNGQIFLLLTILFFIYLQHVPDLLAKLLIGNEVLVLKILEFFCSYTHLHVHRLHIDGDAVACVHTPLPSGKIGEGAPSPYFFSGDGGGCAQDMSLLKIEGTTGRSMSSQIVKRKL